MDTHNRLASLNGFPTALQLAKEEISARRTRLDEFRARHAMASQIPNLLGHPGFKTFLLEVAKLRDAALSNLLTGSPDSATIMANRERAVALDDILAIVQRHEETAKTLAEQIEAEEQALQ